MTVHFGTPQIIMLALMLIGIIATAKDHGKPRSNENIWVSLAATSMTLSLLIWGGFFR